MFGLFGLVRLLGWNRGKDFCGRFCGRNFGSKSVAAFCGEIVLRGEISQRSVHFFSSLNLVA